MQGPDADYGLHGLQGISQSRNLSQDVFKLAKGFQTIQYRPALDVPSV
jgi:hypothetical protein